MNKDESYKNGYAEGYKVGSKECKKLEEKIKKLEKSNRNWRRKVQRLRNGSKEDKDGVE